MVDFWQIIQNAAVELISPTTAAYALAALGLAIHFGFTGLINFGQAGFMAIGANGYAISTLNFGFPVWGAVLVGIGGSIVFALILGIPMLRLRADYLAIVTIAAAEILRLIFTTNTLEAVMGSADGLSGYKGGFAALNPIPDGTYGFGPFTNNAYDWWLRIETARGQPVLLLTVPKDTMPLTQLTATLLIDVSDRADSCIIVIGDRTILEQHERDSQPTLGAGVTIHSGSFRGISGPGSCPTFGRNSVVLEVLDVDRADALAERLAAGRRSPGVSILSPTV